MLSSERSFARLMHQLRSGDRDATDAVVARFSHRLQALAHRRLDARLRTKIDPEDITQTAFEDFFRRFASGELEIRSWDALWTILAVVVVRRCAWEGRRYTAARRDVRRELPRPEGSDFASDWLDQLAGPMEGPEQTLQMTETIDRLMHNLTKLEREVLRLALLGQTVPDISTGIGRTPRTVYRVMDRLRQLLDEYREESPA